MVKKEKTKKLEKYPGVKFRPNLDKWTATYHDKGVVHVATKDSFEAAKQAMIEFKK